VLIETFIRKQLRLKSHTVTKVEESEEWMTVHIDRLGRRLLRCGLCHQRCREIYDICKERTWRDLSMRKLSLRLCYRPRRVGRPRCGVRVEDFPWAEPWAGVTTALANAVAVLARELSWQGTARHYGLNWKSVATIVKRAVEYGLCHRRRPPVHVIGIDEVSRRKGQVYLTVVYDLERRVSGRVPARGVVALALFCAATQAQPSERGLAGWYGAPFDGQMAASGEIYHQVQFTAVHRTLPFGTTVRIRRVDTGASVVVLINESRTVHRITHCRSLERRCGSDKETGSYSSCD
jgi:hypothetical protein